ncbi:redoxin domain-containing protein [Rathayibacter soli]|uniref:redoxin domain-containing protein n=1 Tax=Rathayibacter soli TaxID=3144168 RepID=UPI0027E5ACF3|nr:redoxin domain-containing protein [Glaciibacter superstes]
MTEPTPTPNGSTQDAATHRPRNSWIAWAAGGAALTLALIGIIAVGTAHGSPANAADVMPGINQASASVLQLDLLDGKPFSAPPFSLTDQNGRRVSLAQFAGESVVLTFNDDECTDLCTLLAQDVVAANRDLAGATTKVAFVSINANPYYPQVSAVKSWTDAHGLGHASNWYYGTADPTQLSALWRSYGVPVEADAATKTVVHGTEVFFIGPAGHERALGQFGTESADTAVFAHTMAQAAIDLLPARDRSAVRGPAATAPQPGGAQIGATPPAVTLPMLDASGSKLSTSINRGKYQVVNFWSSTCTACVSEMPDLQKASQDLGSQIAFVGIDVSDTPDAGQAFAKRSGTTYPLLADANGSVAGQFQISGLPYTVILGPKGKVLVRHPGTFTTEQLEYVVQSLDPKLGGAQ